MDDRLLRYHEPSTPARAPGFSRYGITATSAALFGVVLCVLAFFRRLPNALDPLVAGCVAFCGAVAVFGWLLAAQVGTLAPPVREQLLIFWGAVVAAAIGIFAFGVSAGFIHF